jgi:hypothetical protein
MAGRLRRVDPSVTDPLIVKSWQLVNGSVQIAMTCNAGFIGAYAPGISMDLEQCYIDEQLVSLDTVFSHLQLMGLGLKLKNGNSTASSVYFNKAPAKYRTDDLTVGYPDSYSAPYTHTNLYVQELPDNDGQGFELLNYVKPIFKVGKDDFSMHSSTVFTSAGTWFFYATFRPLWLENMYTRDKYRDEILATKAVYGEPFYPKTLEAR